MNSLLVYFYFIAPHLSINYNKYTQYILFTSCNMYTYLYNHCHKIPCLVVSV